VFRVTEALRAMLIPNVPDEDADQKLMYVSVSGLVPAQDDHSGSLLIDTSPPETDPQVTDSRVVTDETFDVPAEPGSPV
jgi:hypothetical protein